jgi:phosphomannomutase
MRQSVPCSWGKKGQVMRELLKYTENLNRQLIDGVRVIEDDSWVLVTPDRRKATFHIYAEAKDPAKAEAFLKEYARKVEEWQIEKEMGIMT